MRYSLRQCRTGAASAASSLLFGGDAKIDRFEVTELLAQLEIAHGQLARLAATGSGESAVAAATNTTSKGVANRFWGRSRAGSEKPAVRHRQGRTPLMIIELQPSDIAAIAMLSRRIACKAAELVRYVTTTGSGDLEWLRFINRELRARSRTCDRLARQLWHDPGAVPRLPSPLAAVDTPDDDEPTAVPIMSSSGRAAFTAAAAARVAPFRRFEMLAGRKNVHVAGGVSDAVTPELFLEVRKGKRGEASLGCTCK